jgi:four helix bundle protein
LVFKLLENKAFEKNLVFKPNKRTVISITNNIAEGSEYNSNKQLIKYLKISKGSCAEVNILVLSRSLVFATKPNSRKLYSVLKFRKTFFHKIFKYKIKTIL